MALAALGGCAQSGVGDPCIPESIPCSTDPAGVETCGYEPSESYVEGSSVQCRTRVCVVNELEGDPRDICQPNGPTEDCVTAEELDQRIFCSCRCDAPADVVGNFELCDCPGGWECKEMLSEGGDGIRGSYCVKPEPPEGL